MKINKMMQRILFYAIIIAIWQLIFYFGVDIFKVWKFYTFPSPYGVLQSFTGLSEVLVIAILTSLKRMIIGYLISIVIGVAFGILILRVKLLNENLKPVILGIQTLPSVCWIPFSILWFGINESSITFVIVMGSAFSICIAVDSAIRNISPLYLKAAGTMGVGKIRMFTKIIFPASLPNLITGLKQGWSFAWRALMAGEMISSSKGLGQILMIGRELADINQMMCVIIVIIVIGLIADNYLFGIAEKKVRIKWGLEARTAQVEVEVNV